MWSLLTAGVLLILLAAASPSLAVLVLDVAADLPRPKLERDLLVDARVVYICIWIGRQVSDCW